MEKYISIKSINRADGRVSRGRAPPEPLFGRAGRFFFSVAPMKAFYKAGRCSITDNIIEKGVFY
ncbi:MAG: hypothetical protein KGQ70_05485, partial [Alphaproteobacteria bacterium]|nr:hypothetical protein [Alphaproteobacteria bacterium]